MQMLESIVNGCECGAFARHSFALDRLKLEPIVVSRFLVEAESIGIRQRGLQNLFIQKPDFQAIVIMNSSGEYQATADLYFLSDCLG